jgi:hypothetical protein
MLILLAVKTEKTIMVIWADGMKILKGAGMVAIWLMLIGIVWLAVVWWDVTWKVAIEPTRASIYRAPLGPSPCLRSSWDWRENGCRVI